LRDFKIETISNIAKGDIEISGNINGNTQEPESIPIFTSDLIVDNFHSRKTHRWYRYHTY
jgi:hypothetical protein